MRDQTVELRGYAYRYVGDNWKKSVNDDWDLVMAHAKVKKVGTLSVDGHKHNVYSCNECPHTFYAVLPGHLYSSGYK